MIPFNFFRRHVQSPTAQLYYSGLLDSVDYWGREDRQHVIDGARLYAKYYALDWALTTAVIVFLTNFLSLVVCNIFNIPFSIDYTNTLLTIMLCASLTYLGVLHIIDCYQQALDLKLGGDYDGL